MKDPERSVFARARHWYKRFERPISSLSLVGGFVFDALMLRRVDLFWENFWVVAHLAIVTACAVWINLLENTGNDEANPEKFHFWLVNIIQFFFGGILSTYLVFYFRSGTLATSWPFLLILAAAFVANESLKRRYARLAFQVTLLFLAFYAFTIYLMPILLHAIGPAIFLISGAVSVAAIGAVLFVLTVFSRERFAGKKRRAVFFVIAGILAVVNALYFFKFIPPLPLSLRDADVYHSLVPTGPGRYTVTDENYGAASFFTLSQTVHIVSGDALYAYTAVFSPAALNTDIVHEWQYYDAAKNAWITRGRIPLSVVGGSDGGYRTFSEESMITAGAWRVNVETPDGAIIGRLRFDVIVQSAEPATETKFIGA